MALRDLRPAGEWSPLGRGWAGWARVSLTFPSCLSGSKTRKIPYPTKNPFTWLFLLVSCPNYTYEVRARPLPSPSRGLRFHVKGQSREMDVLALGLANI